MADVSCAFVVVTADLSVHPAGWKFLLALLDVQFHATNMSVTLVVCFVFAVSLEVVSHATFHLVAEALSFVVSCTKSCGFENTMFWTDVFSAFLSSEASAAMYRAAHLSSNSSLSCTNHKRSLVAAHESLFVTAVGLAFLLHALYKVAACARFLVSAFLEGTLVAAFAEF
jgi:hypothetical protein